MFPSIHFLSDSSVSLLLPLEPGSGSRGPRDLIFLTASETFHDFLPCLLQGSREELEHQVAEAQGADLLQEEHQERRLEVCPGQNCNEPVVNTWFKFHVVLPLSRDALVGFTLKPFFFMNNL